MDIQLALKLGERSFGRNVSGGSSQPGVHVPLRLHLPIWMGLFEVSNRRENIFIYCLFPNIYTYISKDYFQASVCVCCWIYLWLVMINILSLDILEVHAEGVHGYRKFGKPWSRAMIWTSRTQKHSNTASKIPRIIRCNTAFKGVLCSGSSLSNVNIFLIYGLRSFKRSEICHNAVVSFHSAQAMR